MVALFESGEQDYARKRRDNSEKCIDQTVTGEKAKIRKYTSKDTV